MNPQIQGDPVELDIYTQANNLISPTSLLSLPLSFSHPPPFTSFSLLPSLLPPDPYANPQQQYLAAAAAVAQQQQQQQQQQQPSTHSIQQIANFQQLIQRNNALYKQAVNQAMANKSLQDLERMLLQQQQQQQQQLQQQQQQQTTTSQQQNPPQLSVGRNVPATSVSKAVSGGVISYPQVGGALHSLQQHVAGGKQGGVTQINAHHRLPTLTPNKIRAPISHVPGYSSRSMPTLTPGPGGFGTHAPNSHPPPLSGQSAAFMHHHQNKSTPGKTGNDRPHLPSQQVT